MNAQLIQKQIPLGSRVKFSLAGGSDISGSLVGIEQELIKIETVEGQAAMVPIDRIIFWQLLDTSPINGGNSKPSDEGKGARESEIEITKKEVEIKARFQAKRQSAKIGLKEPDFVFPTEELSSGAKKETTVIWNRIRDKYQYAKKVNELGAAYGRIQPILTELENMANWFRSSASVKRHLAYFYTLSNNRQDALKSYREAAISSQNEIDWYNLAVVAQETGNGELACYSLSQLFRKSPAMKELDAWYMYINLLLKFDSHRDLIAICRAKSQKISQKETALLLETAVYLLIVADEESGAREALRKPIAGVSVSDIREILNALDREPTEGYQSVIEEFSRPAIPNLEDRPPRGHIYSYNSHQGYGFIRDQKGTSYFFHVSAITDPMLREDITRFTSESIPVDFQTTQGPKGPKAIRISRHKTIHDWYELAESVADAGDYGVAISHIRRVLSINKNYPNARENHDKWREYARVIGVPKGSSYFARAKRAQLVEKDLDKAEKLFRQAILQNDNLESAVNDLASLLSQRERFEDAVKVIEQNRSRIRNKRSLDNVLTTIYKKGEMHDKAIALLKKQLRQEQTEKKEDIIQWQIASSYFQLNKHEEAEKLFREILKRQPDLISAKRNLALCLSRQERYDEAEDLLNQILAVSSDAGATALLEAVLQAKKTGERELVDDIAIETELSDYSSGQISSFTQFFLDGCDFTGVPPERVRSKKFRHSDISYLERQATESKTFRPSDRASYYLSATKIIRTLEDKDPNSLKDEDPNRFYVFLCKSFASKGDDIVVKSGNLDAAREWYAEALSVYDGDRSQRKDEQDAVNALVRFLYSRLGRSHVPLPPHTPTIDDTINEVIKLADSKRIFGDITYLIFRSRYAASRLLRRLYDQQDLRERALQYLKYKGVQTSGTELPRNDFISLWDELSDRLSGETRDLDSRLRYFNNFQLTTAWLEDAIEQAQDIVQRLRFDLDQERIRHLQDILRRAVEMCKEVQFEARERLCRQIDDSCRDLLKEIEASPTRISVEMFYPIIENIKKTVGEYLDEIYETSKPQLTLRLPVESYVPDTDEKIEVQIAVENESGRSPAESLALVVEGDSTFFQITELEIKRDGSLRGGEQSILKVPLRVTAEALASQTFSLPIYARYRTRAEVEEKTTVENFSIRLYSKDEFEDIENPYAAYAEGGIVGDPAMFFGRTELLQNIASVILESRLQSKCVMVFGQKRSGKSSVLYHLKTLLQKDADILILDLGNIGAIQDENSSVQLLYQILKRILTKLEYAIEDRVDEGFSPLALSVPNDREFYDHPAPLQCFEETFGKLKRLASKQADWRGVRVVLLIDEFQYIYGRIVAGKISESFMKNWKALLQANYFNAVLVGQDVMPKFKLRFPNEFGTTQDERVTYLKPEDARRLIDDPIRIGGRQGESRYRENAIERILNLTAGSPFYIQIICNRLVEYMNVKRARLVTEADVEQVKNELIRGVNALALDKFDNLINSGDTSEDAISDEDALKILKTIADNSGTGPCHRDRMDGEISVDTILDDLVKRDVVECDQGQYYRIRVGLFNEWLIVNG